MTLQEYFATQPHGAQAALARKIGISKTWMNLLTSERDVPSAEIAVLIEKHTDGKVTRAELRPDLFGEIK